MDTKRITWIAIAAAACVAVAGGVTASARAPRVPAADRPGELHLAGGQPVLPAQRFGQVAILRGHEDGDAVRRAGHGDGLDEGHPGHHDHRGAGQALGGRTPGRADTRLVRGRQRRQRLVLRRGHGDLGPRRPRDRHARLLGGGRRRRRRRDDHARRPTADRRLSAGADAGRGRGPGLDRPSGSPSGPSRTDT